MAYKDHETIEHVKASDVPNLGDKYPAGFRQMVPWDAMPGIVIEITMHDGFVFLDEYDADYGIGPDGNGIFQYTSTITGNRVFIHLSSVRAIQYGRNNKS